MGGSLVRARACPLAFGAGEYAGRGRGHSTINWKYAGRDHEWVESSVFGICGAAVPFMGCARLLMGSGNFNVNWVLFDYLDVCWQQVLTCILLKK